MHSHLVSLEILVSNANNLIVAHELPEVVVKELVVLDVWLVKLGGPPSAMFTL